MHPIKSTARERVLLAIALVMLAPTLVAAQEASRSPKAPAAIAPPPVGVKYIPDVKYCQTPKGPLELDIAYPAEGNGPLPTVVIVHGTGKSSKGRKANVAL